MIRILTLALSGLLLTGCLSNPMSDTSADADFWLIDLKSDLLCKGETNVCQDLTLLYFDPVKASEVANIYDQKLVGSSNRTALLKLLIKPDNKVYEGTKFTQDGRFYSIPKNPSIERVWKVLAEAEHLKQLIR